VALTAELLSPSDLGARVEFYALDDSVMFAGVLSSLSASLFMGKLGNITVQVVNGSICLTTCLQPSTRCALVPS
jgi:hypothetical protein